jgi:hypothetical protein
MLMNNAVAVHLGKSSIGLLSDNSDPASPTSSSVTSRTGRRDPLSEPDRRSLFGSSIVTVHGLGTARRDFGLMISAHKNTAHEQHPLGKFV